MTEDKSRRYHRLKRRSDAAGLAWGALLLAGLVAGGGAVRLRVLAADVAGGRPYVTVAVMAVVLVAIHELVAAPLAWYSGFTLEHRYGLSRQAWSGWLGDHAKGVAVGLVLGVAAALTVYVTIAWAGSWWWALAGLVFALFTVGLAHLAPVILLPLFFTFTPLRRDALRARLESLAARAGTKVVGVYEWTLGSRTRKANAALTGVGRTRRILVSDTMLEQYSDDEIEVVLAHELGHHVHHDIWRAVGLESVLVLAGFLAAEIALGRLGPWMGLSGRGDPAGLPLIVAAAGAVSLLVLPLGLALSRRHERRADRFALSLTGNSAAFQTAMKRLGAQNLAEESPSALVQWLFYSHPPLEERLDAARQWEATASRAR